MTCRYLYRCLQPASRTFLRPSPSPWQSPISIQSAQLCRAYKTSRGSRKQRASNGNADDPNLAQYWTTIHSAESFLKLPLSKIDGRWRATRLRGRARDILKQKVEKKVEKIGESTETRAEVINGLSKLERDLYLDADGPSVAAVPDPLHEAWEATLKIESKTKPKRDSAKEHPSAAVAVRERMFSETPENAERPKRSKKDMKAWQIQKEGLQNKFKGEAWTPRKKLSPDTMDGIRMLHQSDKAKYTTPVLAESFKVSPDAIRRILRSKWQPTDEESEDRQQRWERRGEKIWTNKVQMGMKPPKKWREMGVGRAEHGHYPMWKKGGKEKPYAQPEPVPFGERYSAVRERREPKDQPSVSSQIL